MPSRFLVALIATLLTGSALAAPDPADPDLNPKGRAILAYLQELQASSDLRLLSGQFCGWGSAATLQEMDKIHAATDRWPALIGIDYCVWRAGGRNDIETRKANKVALAWWRTGGLVSFSWHAVNPNGRNLKDPGPPLTDLLDPTLPAHAAWMQSLDRVAEGLQELQKSGVVVIWRPLHEMNGGWFWWGGQPQQDFIAVWRHMFDYFTKTKGLHNLIWAYSPNHGQKPVASYYPGDAYVDLIGLDAYTDRVDPSYIKGYEDMTKLAKPFGFTEYGPHGASNPPGDFDFRRLLDGIAQHFPRSRHFLIWNEKWNPAENRFAREFYQDPRVITREALPAGLAGK